MDCVDCGELIPAKRLAAKPNATRCVGCQSVVDADERVTPEKIGGSMVVMGELDDKRVQVSGEQYIPARQLYGPPIELPSGKKVSLRVETEE